MIGFMREPALTHAAGKIQVFRRLAIEGER